MPTRSVAIRLGVEGQAEVRRALDEAGAVGQQAFQKIGTAADASGAATDRQTARYQKLAQAARDAESQARAQANVNALFGIGAEPAGSARASAAVFTDELERRETIARARAEQAAMASQARINSLLGVRDATPGAARASASVFEEDLGRRDAIEKARAEQFAQISQTRINQILRVRDVETGAARASAAVFEEAFRDEAAGLKRTADLRAEALRSAAAGWGRLGAAGGATLANIQASRRLGAMGLGSGASEGASGRRLRQDETTNLMYQGGDILAQLGSGSPLGLIAMQQGPQIAQIFAGPGGASVRESLKQATESVTAFASRIGLLGGAIGAVGAAFLTATYAAYRYSSEQQSLRLSTLGVGRASGATLQDLNTAADAGARGGVSLSTSREIVAQLNATGRIDPRVYGDVAANMRDLAKVMGTDVPTASEAVTSALSGGLAGFDRLNASLGLGGAALRQQIKDLYASGDAYTAQRVIVDAYAARVAEAAKQKGLFDRLNDTFAFGRNTSNEINAIGGAVSSLFTPRSPEVELSRAQRRLSDLQSFGNIDQSGVATPADPAQIRAAADEVAKLERSIKATATAGKDAKIELRSLTVQPLLDTLNPTQVKIGEIRAQAESIKRFLNEGGIDKDGSARRTMDGLNAQAKQLADDLSRGGTNLANSLREAQFNLRTVGFSEFGKQDATYRERARSEIAALQAGNLEPAERDAQIRTIEERLKTELDTLRQDTLRSSATGGRYSIGVAQAPERYRQMILDSAAKYGQDPDLMAAMIRRESRFTEGLTSPAGAKGIAQFMPGTAARFGVDVNDPASSIDGMARYLQVLNRMFGGNVADMIAGYNRGEGAQANWIKQGRDPATMPKETRGYLSEVLTAPPGTADQVQEMAARNRQLQTERESLRLAREAGGRDEEGLRARTEAMQAASAAQGRGIVLTKEQIALYQQEAAARSRIVTGARLLQFGLESQFDREQLGRDRVDQNAYARLRQIGLNDNDPRAAGVLETSRMNDYLRETKALATDAFGGMLSDLRQGNSLASSLTRMTDRFADRLLSMAADKTISSLFAGTGGSNGEGIFGTIASFFAKGFSGGGHTGYGDRSAVAGVVHGREYVFDAASTERLGVPFLESLRQNPRGYSGGGYVVPDGYVMPRPIAANDRTVFQTTVINNTPSQVETREVPDGRGGRRQEIIVNEMVASGITSPQARRAASAQRVAVR